MLNGKHLARAPKARLDFIHNQQCATLITNPPRGLDVFRGRRIHTAFALHHFENHSGGFFVHGFIQRFDVVIRNMAETQAQAARSLRDIFC